MIDDGADVGMGYGFAGDLERWRDVLWNKRASTSVARLGLSQGQGIGRVSYAL